MATATPTVTPISDNAILFTWVLTSTNTDGAPIHPKYSDYRDRSVQISGTFGSATVVIEGSNIAAATTYATLNDPSSTALSKTAAAFEQILELALWMRPNSSGGGGTQDVAVNILCVRNHLPRGQ